MPQQATTTRWLDLIAGDARRDGRGVGRAIVRLSHLAAAMHRARAAQQLVDSGPANGLAAHDTDRLTPVATGDASTRKEVRR